MPIIEIDFLPVYLVKINENENQPTITSLHLQPRVHSFSIFSLQFSLDGSEIIGGSNDTHVYIYDLHKGQRTLRVNQFVRKKISICRYLGSCP